MQSNTQTIVTIKSKYLKRVWFNKERVYDRM